MPPLELRLFCEMNGGWRVNEASAQLMAFVSHGAAYRTFKKNNLFSCVYLALWILVVAYRIFQLYVGSNSPRPGMEPWAP